MLRQVEDQPEALSWLVPWGKFFKDVDNSGQLVPTFLSKYRRKHKKSRVLFILEYFILITALMCFHSIFNLLKRVTDGNFVFLCKMCFFFYIYRIWARKLGIPKIDTPTSNLQSALD